MSNANKAVVELLKNLRNCPINWEFHTMPADFNTSNPAYRNQLVGTQHIAYERLYQLDQAIASLQAQASGSVTQEPANRNYSEKDAERVARAFWRRIQGYIYTEGAPPHPLELPSPCPVEFVAHMRTALKVLDSTTLPTQMSEVPKGWKLVPIHPTRQMLKAGGRAGVNAPPESWCPATYQAMINAAPTEKTDGDNYR